MSGIQPTGNLIPSNYATQTGSAYPLNIDAAIAAYQRIAGAFAPRPQPTPNMTMLVDPGHIPGATVGAWSVGNVASGSNSITLTGWDITGIAVGNSVVAYTYVAGVLTYLFPVGTVVTVVSGATITTSQNATGTQTGANLIFGQPVGQIVTGTSSNGSAIVTGLQSTAGMFAGMAVAGPGVGAGVTVLSVDSVSQIHLSSTAGAGAGAGTFTVTVPIPASNPRIDRVCINQTTGVVSWVAGTPGASPSAPAVPAGYTTGTKLFVATSTTALTNTSNFSDDRELGGLGASSGGFGAQAAITSAATTDLGTIPSHNASITGVVTITSFGSSALTSQPIYLLQFAGALTLTHNAASLIIPGGANILTAANDCMLVEYLGSGNWRVVSYWPAAGTVYKIVAGTGLTGGTITNTGTLAIGTTGVSAGSYTAANITVNAQGQLSSAANGSPGIAGTYNSTLYNTAGTFTHTLGSGSVKATVVGGGGGSAANQGGGGGGAAAVQGFSGLTVGNTVIAIVGAAGASTGGNGGTSSLSSGSQTIVTLSAAGGGGVVSSNNGGSGGSATSGASWSVGGMDGAYGNGTTILGSGGSTLLGFIGAGAKSSTGNVAGRPGGVLIEWWT